MTIENAEKAKELLETLDRLNSDLEEIDALRETWRQCGKKISLEITEVDDCCVHWEMTPDEGEKTFEMLLNGIETKINAVKTEIESL